MASKKVETISSQDQAGISQGQLIRRRFLKHRGAMIGLVVLIFVIVISFSSVGTVVGGTGKLIVDASGSFAIDGFRIPGWWKYNWYENYDLLNVGGTPTLTLFPPSLGEHPFSSRSRLCS